MTRVFLYLTWCSTKNRTRARLKRLREPRYLIGTLFAIAYLGFLFTRRGPQGRRSPVRLTDVMDRFHDPIVFGASLFVFGAVLLGWLLAPSASRILSFTPAEVQGFFPAPITRRQLVHFRILRSQLAVLFSSVLVTVIFRPGALLENGQFFLGFMLATVTLNVHLMGVGLARESIRQHGWVGLNRQFLPLSIVACALLVLVAAAIAHGRELFGASATEPTLTVLFRAWSSPVSSAVLLPFRALAELPLARSAAEFVSHLPVALAVLAASYLWVLRTDVAFEEAAAEAAERVLTRRSDAPAPSVARRTAPFTLTPTGRPEVALLWKNLIAVSRLASWRTVSRAVPAMVVGAALLSRVAERVAWTVAPFAAMAAAFVVLFGPQMARNDLRQDIGRLAILKTWPVRGGALFIGEALGPIVLLTITAWSLLAVAVAAVPELPSFTRFGWGAPTLIASAVILIPCLISLQVLAQNVLAILWPAWVSSDVVRARGLEAMGQRLLMTVFMALVLVVGLAPAIIAGGLVGAAIYAAWRVVPLFVVALVAALTVIIECAIAAEMAGKLLDRTDLGDT